jgi:hypothetical protein
MLVDLDGAVAPSAYEMLLEKPATTSAATPPKRRTRPAAVKPKELHLACELQSVIRSNDGRITEQGRYSFSFQFNQTTKKVNAYGVVPTFGDELIFDKPVTFRSEGGIIRFPSAPLGIDRVVQDVQIDTSSGAMTYLNRHQAFSVFGAIPLYNSFALSGYCKPKAASGPVIPGM